MALKIDINERSGVKESTPAMYAIEAGQNLALKELHILGADLEMPDRHGSKPLHYATVDPNLGAIEFLIQSKVNIDSTNDFGQTPLMTAALHCNPDAIELLILNGANIHAREQNGTTALDMVTGITGYSKREKRSQCIHVIRTAISSQSITNAIQDGIQNESKDILESNEPPVRKPKPGIL